MPTKKVAAKKSGKAKARTTNGSPHARKSGADNLAPGQFPGRTIYDAPVVFSSKQQAEIDAWAELLRV